MVNLVIVSHSAQLGEGVGALARQMLMGGDCKIAIAAGLMILRIRLAPSVKVMEPSSPMAVRTTCW